MISTVINLCTASDLYFTKPNYCSKYKRALCCVRRKRRSKTDPRNKRSRSRETTFCGVYRSFDIHTSFLKDLRFSSQAAKLIKTFFVISVDSSWQLTVIRFSFQSDFHPVVLLLICSITKEIYICPFTSSSSPITVNLSVCS